MNMITTNPFNDITIVKGKDCFVIDSSGKKYLDLLSGVWCNILGHCHPKIVKVINQQISKIVHTGYQFATKEIDEAVKELRPIVPEKLTNVVFLNTGSEAVEFALKIAQIYNNKSEIVVIEKGYYGATARAISISEAGFKSPFGVPYKNIYRLPAPTCRNCPEGKSYPCGDFPCLNTLKEIYNKKNISAIIFEPVMAVGGIIVLPRGYINRLREYADNYGAVLISEEVTTGIGRTGKWFGFQHSSAIPDILILGKAIGAGLPVSAVIITDKINKKCATKYRHVQSHQNDPFSGKIAAEVIKIIKNENLIQRCAEVGKYFLELLNYLQTKISLIKEVRGIGLMIGVEIEQEKSEIGQLVYNDLLEKGFICDYLSNISTFRFFPPYIIKKQDIERFVNEFKKSLNRCTLRGN